MTLTQPQRVSLGRLIDLLRADWDSAGVHDACVKLAAQDGNPFQLCTQAIVQASNAANRTPESVCWPLRAEAVVRRLPGVRPENVEPCPEHGGTVLHQNGRHSCCLNADAEPLPVSRSPHPPPEHVKALVAAQKTEKGTR